MELQKSEYDVKVAQINESFINFVNEKIGQMNEAFQNETQKFQHLTLDFYIKIAWQFQAYANHSIQILSAQQQKQKPLLCGTKSRRANCNKSEWSIARNMRMQQL